MKKSCCSFCQKKCNKIYLFDCNYCNQQFCIKHSPTDIHNCINIDTQINELKENFVTQQKELFIKKNKVSKI